MSLFTLHLSLFGSAGGACLIVAEVLPNVLFFAGLLVMAGFLLRWTRRRQQRQVCRDPLAEARQAATAERPSLPAALGQWEVQMHELARDLSAQLDTKIIIVEQLLRRAEEQTSRLEAAINRASQTLDQHSPGAAGGNSAGGVERGAAPQSPRSLTGG